MPLNDVDLQERWLANRDAQAFRDIVRLHAPMVYRTCRRVLGNESDAEEVAQECFLHLSKRPRPVSPSLGGWLHTVATRRSLDRIRGDQRRRKRERLYTRDTGVLVESAWPEVQSLVDECIASLPSELHEPVVCYFLEQKPQSEIAKDLGISQSTVSRRIDEGIAQIREALTKRGVQVSSAGLAAMFASEMAEAAPASLTSALGKLAIAGTSETGKDMAVVVGLAAGGVFEMKKYAFAAALVLLVALAVWRGAELFTGEDASDNRTFVEPSATAADVARESESASSTPSPGPRVPLVDVDDTGNPARPLSAAQMESSLLWRGTVSGKVVWARSKSPVSDRTVRLWSEPANIDRRAVTGALGNFQFRDLSQGEYEIKVLEENVFPERQPAHLTLLNGQDRDNLVLRISEGGALEGIVTVGGEPAPEMEAEIVQIGSAVNYGPLRIRTDAEGWYRLTGILEGERTFVAQLDDGGASRLWSNMVRASIQTDETTIVNFEIPGGNAALEGLVTINGKPAPEESVAIVMYEKSGNEALATVFVMTDEEGYYSLENVPEAEMVVGASLSLGGSRRLFGEHTRIRTRSGETTFLNFAFARGSGYIEGLITVSGTPQPDARLYIMDQMVKTDAQGFYRATDVPEGTITVSARLTTTGGTMLSSESKSVKVSEGETSVVDFDFPGGTASVQGYIFTDRDIPVHARVIANFRHEGGDEGFASVESRSDGLFKIDGLPPGPAVLLLRLPNGDDFLAGVFPIDLVAGETIEHDIFVPSETLFEVE